MFDSVFKRVFRLIFMQSSPQLHERLTKKLVDFVKSNIISNSKKEVRTFFCLPPERRDGYL